MSEGRMNAEAGDRGISVVGAILAGGLSRRMEGPEKTLLELAGEPLVGRVRDRLARQCGDMVLNANGDPARFDFLGLPVQPDTVEGFAGPLAGVLAAMDWCAESHPSATHVLTVAGDTPFFPLDYAARMQAALAAEDDPQTVCLAFSGGNRHPTFGLWPLSLREALREFLVAEGERKVMLFAGRHNLVKVDFPLAEDGSDPFFNINTPQDLDQATTMIGKTER